MTAPAIPNALLWRRLHSLTGLWLVVYLTTHLLTNSQAALYIGDDGEGFITAVQSIHHLPYLRAIEIFLLALPFGIHIIYGLYRIFMAEPNSSPTDGSKPALGQYPRNRAFTWMRITSWILLFGVILHVLQMRVLEYPWHTEKDGHQYFMNVLKLDSGLYTLSERLDVELYDAKRIERDTRRPLPPVEQAPIATSMLGEPAPEVFDQDQLQQMRAWQNAQEERQWIAALNKRPINQYEVVAVSKDFATSTLLVVRDTFKSPLMVALYSLFVLAACYHGFNGLWTFLITWGITLTERSQRLALWLSSFLMIVVAFLGLAAAVGTYWFNLRY
ncbi:MAG: hypothetical protein Q8K75_00070 [Chlamydiales bacterium]|nr:hypothetical protein [Chlamydiales bacterium]